MVQWKGQGHYIWFQHGCRSCQNKVEDNNELPSKGAPTPDFSSGLIRKAFPVNRYAARQQRFEIRVFLPLGGLPSQTDDRAPPTRSNLVLRCQIPALTRSPVSRISSATSTPGVGLSCQRLFETHAIGSTL